MKNILLLPFFRFGNRLNSVTIRTIEIYSRINKKNFNFIINLDLKTYNMIDNKYYYDKIKHMDKSYGYAIWYQNSLRISTTFLIGISQ